MILSNAAKISSLLMALACASRLTAATYYVAPNGNDDLSASQATSVSTPWQTIQKAANNMGAGDTCLIRAGTYRETVTVPVSGTAVAPITFQPYGAEVVIISGSQPITIWTHESTNIYRASNMPAGWTSLGNGNQVFQGGIMKPEARWPNAGSTFPWQNSSIKPSPDWTYVTSVSYSSNTTGQAVDAQLPARPNGYWTGATLHMMSGYGWVMECPLVTGYRDATKTLNFTHGDWGGGADNAFNVTAGNEFYITGIKGEMDSPGEWFYDTTTSRLCFYSTSLPTNVEVKQRAYGFDLSGRSFINLTNLQFFACTINTSPAPTMTTDCTFDGLTMKYLNHSSLTDAAAGLNLGSRCVLRNSELSFASGGLVYMNGSDVRVINNKLHDGLYSPTFWGGIASSDYGADGNAAYRNLISHNTIYNFGRAVIGYPGRSPIIEYNDIHDGMILASDGGLCYWAKDGSNGIIRYNLIHDAQGPVGHIGSGVMGFYIDNENSGWVAHHNVIWNISGTAMQNNARNNFDMIFNNTCWNCGAGSISTGFWSDGPTGAKYFNNLFNGKPSGNQQPWNLSDARYNLYTDPVLVDPANLNFQLQATSPAINQGKVITGITDGYMGSAPDIGAVEYGAPDWTGSAGYHSSPPSPDPTYSMPAMPFANQLQDGSFETGNLANYWTVASGSNAGLIQSDAWGDKHLRSSYFSVQFGGGTSQLSQAVTGLMPHQQYKFYCGVEKTDPTAVVTVSVRTNGLPDQTITVPTTSPWQQQAYQPVPTMFAVPFFTVDGNATVSVTVARTSGSTIVPAGATTAAPVTPIYNPSVYPTTGVYIDDLAVIWSEGQPGLILNEGFDYPSGTLDDSQNGGSGFASGSNWGNGGADIVTGLTYTNLTSIGSGAIRPSSQGIHTRAVSPSFGGSTFYMSMLINTNSHGTGRFGIGLGNGSGPMFGRVNGGWGMCTGTNGSLGISNASGDNQTWTGVTAAADSLTHLIVVKVNYETNALNLYVDPTPGTAEPTPSATLNSGGGWTLNLNSDLWSAISLVHDLAGMTADELRVGNAWSDVTPANPDPIAEGFDYPPGTVNGSQNGGVGFAAGSSWANSDGTDTIVPSLTYPSLATVGKGAIYSTSYGSNERATAAPFGGQTFFVSMLINANGHESGRFGFELRNGEGPMFGRVTGGWGVFSGSNGGMGILNTLGSYQTWTGVTTPADAATHLLVYKVDYKTQSIKMFVDPTPGAAEPAPTAILATGGNWTLNLNSDTWTGVRLFHENAGMIADELHIGSSWSEVVPKGADPLPLPWVEEGFNYPVGNVVGDSTQNGGYGFISGSSWGTGVGGGSHDYTTVTAGLTYPGLASSGTGAIKSVGWAGNTRWFATSHGSGIFYMSMLINAHSTETTRFGFSLGNDGGGPEFGRVNGGWGMFAGANGEFGISNSTGHYKTWTGVTAPADSATHLLVYKFDYTAKTIDMWVDPTLGTGAGMPSPNATLATGGNWTVNLGTAFNSVRCFHEQSNQIADELRIGPTWNTVLPSVYSSWALGYGLNPQTTGAADVISIPNAMPNGIIFVTGGNPNAPSTSNLPTASIVGSNVVFVYPLADAAAPLNPIVQTSTTLTTDSWTDVSSGIVVENGYYGTGLSRVTVTIPCGSSPQLFTRLKVIVP